MKPLKLRFACLVSLVCLVSLFCVAPSEARAQGVTTADAQDPVQSPPGVVLLKLKWSREVYFPRGWDRGPYDASLGSNGSLPSLTPEQQRQPSPSGPFPRGGRLPYVYHYTAKIRNDGAKEIRAVLWDYVVRDPAGGRELGRHQFYASAKIGEREQATLRGRSLSEPSKVVTAAGLEKDKQSPFDERFEVRCVMYADGSLWTHPSAGRFECTSLARRGKARRRRDTR